MSNNNLLAEKSVKKGLFILGGLGVISMISEGMYAILDKYFVSTLGIEEVQAVSLVFGITFVIIAIAMWLSIGSMAVISTANGSDDSSLIIKGSVTSVLMAFVGGVIINLFLYNFSEELLSIFTMSDTSHITQVVITKANYYLMTFSFAAIPMIVMLNLVFILRSVGFSTIPTIATVMTAIINAGGDYYVVNYTDYGISGIALSTVVSFAISTVFLAIVFVKYISTKNVVDSKLLSLTAAKKILSLGSPSLGKQIGTISAITIFNIFASEVSDDLVAGWGVSNDIFTFALYISYGLNVGMMPMLGYSLGKGDKKRSLEIINTTLVVASIIFTFYSITIFYFANDIMSIYFNDVDTINVGVSVLRILAISFPTVAFIMHGSNALQIMNQKKASLIVGISRQLTFFLPFVGGIFILNKYTGTNYNIVIGQVIADFSAFLIMVYFYRKLILKKLKY